MSLEGTYFCIDSSDAMRNGDYSPTRLKAVVDACFILATHKIQKNRESGVGFLTMAETGDKTVRIVETLTGDRNRLLNSLNQITVSGGLDFVKGLHIGQLGLKHRQNKHQRQRLIAFVGSLITASEQELIQLAKKLKKNSVAVDVVSFGCPDNTPLLETFISTVDAKQNDKSTSNLLVVEEGKSIADFIRSSILIREPGFNDGGDGGGGDGFNIDPSDDPELAMALRISMEEERERQARAAEQAAAQRAEGGQDETTPTPVAQAEEEMDLDEEFRRAIELSIQEAEAGKNDEEKKKEENTGESPATDEDEDMDLNEEAQTALALKLSLQENNNAELETLLQDKSFIDDVAAEIGLEEEKKDEKKHDEKKSGDE